MKRQATAWLHPAPYGARLAAHIISRMSDPAAETSRQETPSPWAVATAFVLIYISWGTTYKVTGFAMQDADMPPALFGGVRLLLAGLILLAVQFWARPGGALDAA